MKISKYFSTVETHTCGQPTRTIIGGLPPVQGETIEAKMLHMRDHMDWIRTALMFEPRGSNIMSGVVLTAPSNPEADFGVIFIETGGYLPMCGHDTIGVSTALVETGMVNVEEPITRIALDTPAGLTRVKVNVENGIAKSVTFRNIPSFVMAQDIEVDIPDFGRIRLDVAYGGNVYAILPAAAVGLTIAPGNATEVVAKGKIVRAAVNEQVKIQHPEKEFINECTHVEFYSPPTHSKAHVKNTVFFADKGIDRSPCGTGTSAKVATLYAKGQLKLNEEFVHESITGSLFRAVATEKTKVGSCDAIIPEVTGSAHIIGISQLFIDPDDPLKDGFLLD